MFLHVLYILFVFMNHILTAILIFSPAITLFCHRFALRIFPLTLWTSLTPPSPIYPQSTEATLEEMLQQKAKSIIKFEWLRQLVLDDSKGLFTLDSNHYTPVFMAM